MRFYWYWGAGDTIQETRLVDAGPYRADQLIKEMDPLEREIFRTVLWHLFKKTSKIIQESE